MNRVETFYDGYVENEWNRMERHPLEYALTKKALQQYLPERSRILDIGGGPGRYSLHLAQQGHNVTLLDLSSQNVAFARQKSHELGIELDDYVHGNALDLSRFDASSFDAVLLMGPLYHLTSQADRAQACREALRVLKPGGIIFAAFINRFAPVYDTLIHETETIARVYDRLRALLLTGVNESSEDFTDSYFAHPGEVVPSMESFGLKTLRFLGAEGFGIQREESLKQLAPEDFALWVELSWLLASEPSVLGSAMHFLYVGQT